MHSAKQSNIDSGSPTRVNQSESQTASCQDASMEGESPSSSTPSKGFHNRFGKLFSSFRKGEENKGSPNAKAKPADRPTLLRRSNSLNSKFNGAVSQPKQGNKTGEFSSSNSIVLEHLKEIIKFSSQVGSEDDLGPAICVSQRSNSDGNLTIDENEAKKSRSNASRQPVRSVRKMVEIYEELQRVRRERDEKFSNRPTAFYFGETNSSAESDAGPLQDGSESAVEHRDVQEYLLEYDEPRPPVPVSRDPSRGTHRRLTRPNHCASVAVKSPNGSTCQNVPRDNTIHSASALPNSSSVFYNASDLRAQGEEDAVKNGVDIPLSSSIQEELARLLARGNKRRAACDALQSEAYPHFQSNRSHIKGAASNTRSLRAAPLDDSLVTGSGNLISAREDSTLAVAATGKGDFNGQLRIDPRPNPPESGRSHLERAMASLDYTLVSFQPMKSSLESTDEDFVDLGELLTDYDAADSGKKSVAALKSGSILKSPFAQRSKSRSVPEQKKRVKIQAR